MIKTGILNPALLSLLARIRHTNLLVIADRGFPFWPQIETVDISLVDGIPSVLQVFQAVTASCQIGHVWMAEEFLSNNTLKSGGAWNKQRLESRSPTNHTSNLRSECREQSA